MSCTAQTKQSKINEIEEQERKENGRCLVNLWRRHHRDKHSSPPQTLRDFLLQRTLKGGVITIKGSIRPAAFCVLCSRNGSR